MPIKSPLYTLVYVENAKPVTLEFRDLDSLALHIQTEEITPADDSVALLVDGKEASWTTRLTIHVDMPQPDLATPKKRTRRTKAQIEADNAAALAKKNAKANGTGKAVVNGEVTA